MELLNLALEGEFRDVAAHLTTEAEAASTGEAERSDKRGFGGGERSKGLRRRAEPDYSKPSVASPPQEQAERSGKRGFGGGSPRLPCGGE